MQDASSLLVPVKYIVPLGLALAAIWLLWSGHFDPFLLFLGSISVGLCVWLARRMGVTDEEGTPLGLKLATVGYVLWLGREIVVANLEVTRILLAPKLCIRPRLVRVRANQKSEIGRVILANSITLTPGTVSVDMVDGNIWVHALSFEGAEEDLSGEMDRRICSLER